MPIIGAVEYKLYVSAEKNSHVVIQVPNRDAEFPRTCTFWQVYFAAPDGGLSNHLVLGMSSQKQNSRKIEVVYVNVTAARARGT